MSAVGPNSHGRHCCKQAFVVVQMQQALASLDSWRITLVILKRLQIVSWAGAALKNSNNIILSVAAQSLSSYTLMKCHNACF